MKSLYILHVKPNTASQFPFQLKCGWEKKRRLCSTSEALYRFIIHSCRTLSSLSFASTSAESAVDTYLTSIGVIIDAFCLLNFVFPSSYQTFLFIRPQYKTIVWFLQALPSLTSSIHSAIRTLSQISSAVFFLCTRSIAMLCSAHQPS